MIYPVFSNDVLNDFQMFLDHFSDASSADFPLVFQRLVCFIGFHVDCQIRTRIPNACRPPPQKKNMKTLKKIKIQLKKTRFSKQISPSKKKNGQKIQMDVNILEVFPKWT